MAASVGVSQVPSKQYSRYDRLRKSFIECYGEEPAFFARAPGRVNLIGEHIDYCGYSVLPMAVEQDIVIAALTSDMPQIEMINTDPKYKKFQCGTHDLHIDRVSPQWFHYVLCGFMGLVEHCGLDEPVGMRLLVDGTIPPSAGLSSSSALVCCAALVTMKCNQQNLSKVELAELCQHCERHIGTEGGGMDQAISFLAEEGKAKHIEFDPIRTTDVQLPDGVVFVISNSCVEMNKAATDHFNVRVAECRLATQVLAKKCGLEWRNIRKLSQLQATLNKTLPAMAALVRSLLHSDPYTKAEVCDLLEVSPEELDETSLTARSRNVLSFHLFPRALHIYTEADRVLQFKAVCDEASSDAADKLGQLMTDSHNSCSQLYDCSCPQLNQLCGIAMRAGALGSRLTGAGWGGCAVSLLPSPTLPTFLTQVTDNYYKLRPRGEDLVNQSLFATEPGPGAALYTVT